MMIFSLRTPFNRPPQENPTLQWATDKEEGPKQIRQFFEKERNSEWSEHCAVELLSSVVRDPLKFENIEETVSLILNDGLNRHYVGWSEEYVEFRIWSMALKDKRPETARAGAILAAELIANQLNEEPYILPLSSLLNNYPYPKKTKDSILAIQNALVDLVTESKDSSSLVTGAEKLALLQGDDDAKLWSEKLADIKTFKAWFPLAKIQPSLRYEEPKGP